jgi:hypothetical protein
MKNKKVLFSFLFILVCLLSIFIYKFYPKQSGSLPEKVKITTPSFYHNDCLHPCIRYIPEGFCGYHWWLVQSPYYNRNFIYENPLLYYSKESSFPSVREFIAEIATTPTKGFNSDPNLFYEDNKLWIFWREFRTSLCDSLHAYMATVGVYTVDGKTFSKKMIYLTQQKPNFDTEQAPVLLKKENKYYFYTSYYQYSPKRVNKGIAIWEGSSLDNPDFILKRIVPFKNIYTCGKWKQLRVGSKLFFIPKPVKHELWHFDLYAYKNKLYMFSVAEWGDNIMLSIADDNINFKTFTLPLVNNHYLEKFTKQRVYFYKPTGYIEKDTIYLYYTATSTIDKRRNDLFKTKIPLEKYKIYQK